MGAEIEGTIRTDKGISSPDSVSTSTMVVPSFCCVKAVVPKEATATSVVDTGVICSSLAIASEIHERCAPSSKSIFAWVLIPPAIIGAIAVLSKQVVVLFSEALQCDAGVRSPLVGVVTSVFCSLLVPSEVLVVSLLQRLVWCFFLHFLQRNLDGH